MRIPDRAKPWLRELGAILVSLLVGYGIGRLGVRNVHAAAAILALSVVVVTWWWLWRTNRRSEP